MWHFLLMMLAPPNACMRLAMSQSSTTLASHAFSASICISFCNSFLALLFPMRQILVQTPNSALCSQAKCSHLLWVLVLFWLLTLQVAAIAEHKALTDDGGTVPEKLLVWVWLFRLAELLSLPSGLQAAVICEA